MKHVSIRVYGKVQGVFFRASAKTRADELEVMGIVRNEPDGSVYIEAEGSEEALREFAGWCGRGPEFARVERCVVRDGELKNYRRFEIVR